ncbi:bacillithiol biosynthesis cysteine-adding enzyme BshC [Scytonema sp. UIC 10036]|nr:bacillithiol biosynthesis cysteine-adding enzyme BshC [Scytonema sp. UIC 10036]
MTQNTVSNVNLNPRDRYDVWAESYDKSTASFGWTAPQFLLEATIHHAPPAGFLRVLDVGVGTGQASLPYLEIGACVTGLDVSPQMLHQAQSKYPQFHALIEHDFNYPLVEAGLLASSFDVILSCGALHFAKDLSRSLTQLRWALAPGGVLAFTYIPPQSRKFSTAAHLHEPNTVEHLLQQLELTVLDHKSFVAYYDGGDSQDPVVYQRVVARCSQPGISLPAILQDIDRTACVDRSRLLDVVNLPLMTGKLTTNWSFDYTKVRNENQDLVETLRSQLKTGEIKSRHLPLPKTTGELARQGKPECDVLVLMPHPDDESIYAGGTIAALAEAGQRVRLVVATDGAAGRGGEHSRRVEQRALELRRAAECLNIEKLECLGLVDFGKYRDASRMQPTTAADALRIWGLDSTLALLVRTIRKHRPQILLTLHPEVDPNYSLHGHHLGLGVAALVAFHLAADPGFIIPEATNLLPWAIEQHYTMVPTHHDGSNILRVEIDRQQKLKALSAYETQHYSTQRLMTDLKTEVPHASFETLQLLQARCRRTFMTATVLPSHQKLHKLAVNRDWVSTYKSIRQRLYPREALTKLLQRQAECWGSSEAVFANIKKLSHPHTVAVVTGQQVGVFGGPAYTLYKALGAIQQAQDLTAQGIPAVPIFWMASYDSDLDEVQHVKLLAHQTEPKTLSLELPVTHRLVGSTPLGEGIHSLLNEMEQALGQLPRSQEVFAALQAIYQAETTFAEAFARWLSLLTKDFGLIILDPSTREFAELARPAIARELFGDERSQIPLARAREALTARGLSETIPTDRDVLQIFFVDADGTRRRMLPAKEGFALQNSNIYLADDAVRNLLEQQPERFTPSALLRPICQDTVLPTIAYVAGPTEQQYFVQLKEVYTWAKIPMPQIVARPSFTVLDNTISKQLVDAGGTALLLSCDDPSNRLGRAGLPEEVRIAFDKLETLQQQCFALRTSAIVGQAVGPEAIALKHSVEQWLFTTEPILKSWGAKRPIEAFTRAKVEFPSLMATVCLDLQRSGSRSSPPPTRNVVSLAQALARLESTLIRSGRRQNASGIAAFAYISPKGKPQERSLGVAELIATHGFAIVSHLLPISCCDRIETRVITVHHS